MAEKIFIAAKANRIENRAAYANRSFLYGSEGHQAKQKYVHNLWDIFWEGHRGEGQQLPKVEDILAFAHHLIQEVKPHKEGEKIAPAATLMGYFSLLEEYLRLKLTNEGFTISPGTVEEIHNLLKEKVDERLALTGVDRPQYRVGFNLVLPLAKRWLANAIINDTASWDRTLVILTACVLQAALGCTADDLLESFSDKKCLAYSDVSFRVPTSGPATVQDIRGRVTLHRGWLTVDDLRFEINPIKNSHQGSVCPVKLMLIIAIRFDLVHGKNIQDVLRHAQLHGGTIVWKRPSSPLLPAVNDLVVSDIKVNHSAGLECEVYEHYLTTLGLIGGLPFDLQSQDIQRGAATAAAFLPHVATPGIENARILLGHRPDGEKWTRQASGYSAPNTWNARAKTAPGILEVIDPAETDSGASHVNSHDNNDCGMILRDIGYAIPAEVRAEPDKFIQFFSTIS
ncbi:hypothetical protein BJY04DRAFT_221659 [Aspergillus karnatakaensis]|uniref:uncharacterized protein n=1 Tax=Aspergillus karnatakaensis TaxID=1810916 RepID=UPI003CCD1C39